MKSRDGLGDTSWHCFMQGLFTAVHKKVCFEQYAIFDILKYSLKERFKGQRQWKVDDMLIFLTFIAACFYSRFLSSLPRYETEYWYIKNGLLFSWFLGCLTAYREKPHKRLRNWKRRVMKNLLPLSPFEIDTTILSIPRSAHQQNV